MVENWCVTIYNKFKFACMMAELFSNNERCDAWMHAHKQQQQTGGLLVISQLQGVTY